MMRATVDDAKAAADAAQQSAQATGKSVTLAKETAERQLQAYVSRAGPPEFKGTDLDQDRRVYRFWVPVKNTGLTPASDVIMRGRVLLLPGFTEESVGAPEPPPEEGTPGAMLGAGETLSVVCTSHPLGQAEIRWIHEDEAFALFVAGEVWYRDAFGQRRTTRFCERVEWSGPSNKPITVPTGGWHNGGT